MTKCHRFFCLPSVKAVSSTYKLLWGGGGGSWHFKDEHFSQQQLFLVNPIRPENPNINTVLERGLVHVHQKGMEEEEKATRQRQSRLLKGRGTKKVLQNKSQGTCLLSFSFKQLHSKVLTVKTNTTLQCRTQEKTKSQSHRGREEKN